MRQRFLIVLSFAAIAAARLLASQAPADAPRKFEVASVKRNTSGRGGWSLNPLPGGRFSAQNISLRQVVLFAYNLRDFQLANDPRSVTARRPRKLFAPLVPDAAASSATWEESRAAGCRL